MDRVESALSLIGDLSRAPTIGRAIDLFQAAIEPFGVRLYRSVALSNPKRPRIDAAIVSNYPEEWIRFYRGVRAFTFDPVLVTSLKGEGFYWRDLPAPTEGLAKALMADGREVGLADGFTVLRHAPGELPTAVFLAGPALTWTDLEQGVINLICNTLMSRVLHLRDVQLAPEVRKLSLREAEILNHAALGRTDKQIADAIGVTHVTVHTYWKEIRRKLSASDRANAVALGLWSGQIAL
jgi:LuxR family transcriptional regulator, quorum-sensing system regulator CciR